MTKNFEYTRIEDISDEHKINTFNRLHKLCLNYAKGVLGRECDDECDSHYIYETALEDCLGKKVFDQLNNEDKKYEL